VYGKGALVGAEIFESVEERGGVIMYLFLWCLMCRSWRTKRTDEMYVDVMVRE
jgi:hypothetical protein